MDLPAEPQLRWILRHTAALLELGAEPVSGLVLPTGDFFPDRFDGSPASLAALMQRVQKLAGLSDLQVDLVVVTPEGEEQTVSCSSGACGGTGKIEIRSDRVAKRDDGSYAVTIGAGEIKSPTVLTTPCEIEFVGAAQTVTGSMHLVRTKHATICSTAGSFRASAGSPSSATAPAAAGRRDRRGGALPRAHRPLRRAAPAREAGLRRAHLRHPRHPRPLRGDAARRGLHPGVRRALPQQAIDRGERPTARPSSRSTPRRT
jgi:hypothetical protein